MRFFPTRQSLLMDALGRIASRLRNPALASTKLFLSHAWGTVLRNSLFSPSEEAPHGCQRKALNTVPEDSNYPPERRTENWKDMFRKDGKHQGRTNAPLSLYVCTNEEALAKYQTVQDRSPSRSLPQHLSQSPEMYPNVPSSTLRSSSIPSLRARSETSSAHHPVQGVVQEARPTRRLLNVRKAALIEKKTSLAAN